MTALLKDRPFPHQQNYARRVDIFKTYIKIERRTGWFTYKATPASRRRLHALIQRNGIRPSVAAGVGNEYFLAPDKQDLESGAWDNWKRAKAEEEFIASQAEREWDAKVARDEAAFWESYDAQEDDKWTQRYIAENGDYPPDQWAAHQPQLDRAEEYETGTPAETVTTSPAVVKELIAASGKITREQRADLELAVAKMITANGTFWDCNKSKAEREQAREDYWEAKRIYQNLLDSITEGRS